MKYFLATIVMLLAPYSMAMPSQLMGADPLAKTRVSVKPSAVTKPSVSRKPSLKTKPQALVGPSSLVAPENFKGLASVRHPQIRHWVQHFTQSEKGRIGKFFYKGSRYKKVIQAMLQEQGLPTELYYLAILESGFHWNARSHAGAVGTWQFIKPTALENGLLVNAKVDERLDPIRSTLAAIRYLKVLYKRYGNWKLALAAYNCGPRRVDRAIQKAGRNFWSLSRKKLLPRETRNYIPQFLALVHIGKNARQYGFNENSKRFHRYIELMYLPSPLKLADLSKASGLSEPLLQRLNPHLKSGQTPASKKNYGLWVPKVARRKLQGLKKRLALKNQKSPSASL